MAIARTPWFRRIQFPAIFAAALLLVTALGCSKSPAPSAAPTGNNVAATPVTGGTFHVASIGEPSNLIPPLVTDSASSEIVSLVYDSLLEYDGKFEFRGELAEKWEVLDGGLRFRFYLRKGVKFHDGYAFTASDVVNTYKIAIDPRTPTPYASNYEKVKYVKAIDDYTIDISYTESYAPALDDIASMYILPAHLIVPSEGIAKNPLNRAPIGTGPYIFVEWQSGVRVKLDANKNYFAGRPNISSYNYRIIPDQQTIFLELKTGHLDQGSLTPIQWEKQTNSEDIQKILTKYEYTSMSYTYLGFNLKRAPFNDKQVRHALNYAINRQQIIEGVLLGHGSPLYGPFPPGMWFSNPNLPEYKYNPTKAKELLAGAGYSDSDGDGILDKNGKKFAFEIITNQGNTVREQCAQIIQANLKDVGIEVQIRIIEWTAFLEKFVDARNFDAIILGWTFGPEPDHYNFWHSSQMGKKQYNFVSYKNARVDELLEIARRTVDRGERKKPLFELQEILADESPYAWLYVPNALVAVNSRIQNVVEEPAGIGDNFEKWWIPTTMQAAIP